MILVLFLSGCAAGHRGNYVTTWPGLANAVFHDSGFKYVVVAQDKRPYVLNGRKPVKFIGIMQSIGGIPYNIYTTTDNPFVDDIGKSITDSISIGNAFLARQITISPYDDISSISNQLKDNERLLHFIFTEWRSVIHIRAGFYHDVVLDVYDSQFNKLGSKQLKGFDYLNQGNPKRKNIDTSATDIFTTFFDSPEIKPNLFPKTK